MTNNGNRKQDPDNRNETEHRVTEAGGTIRDAALNRKQRGTVDISMDETDARSVPSNEGAAINKSRQRNDSDDEDRRLLMEDMNSCREVEVRRLKLD